MAEEKKVTFGLTEKAAYVLIYLFGWISGLIFYFSEKDNKTIRLHALQWLIFSAAYCIVMWVLGAVFIGMMLTAPGVWLVWSTISTILWILYLVMTVLGIVRACNGNILKIPVAYDIAEKKV